jgi:transcription-repair coupling factor (superfamily II helicase)
MDGQAPDQLDEVRLEIPIEAHLPHDYIPSERLRLEMYKRLAEVRSKTDVEALREELVDRYGTPPLPVDRLLMVALFRVRARAAGLNEVTIQGKYVRFANIDLPDSMQVRLQRLYPKSLVKGPLRTMLVPRPLPRQIGGPPLRDEELLAWTLGVIDSVIDPAGAAVPVA